MLVAAELHNPLHICSLTSKLLEFDTTKNHCRRDLQTEGWTHQQKTSLTKLGSHTNAFTHRRVDTQTLLHTGAFTRRCVLHTHTRFHTQTLLHTDAFTHKRFYIQTRLHTDAFTHRRFYTQMLFTHADTLSHTNAFTHRRLYTQTLLHKRKRPSQFFLSFWRPRSISCKRVTIN